MASRLLLGVIAAMCVSLLAACGSTSREVGPLLSGSPSISTPPPGALPADGLQPWERTNAGGFAVPRGASAITTDSEFVPGVERFSEGGITAGLGEAFSIGSAAKGIGYAIYRIPLGGEQPGAVSVDANLSGAGEYFVGVSDYGSSAWSWRGPFSEAQVTLDLPAGDYLSNLGNLFICVLAYDGSSLDVVAVGAATRTVGDTTPPPAPGAPQLTPVRGGFEVAWVPSIAGDLAGYRVYMSYTTFSSPADNGVSALPYLERSGRTLLTERQVRDNYVAIAAVDVSGNESALSPVASATPLSGSAAPPLELSVSAPSGQVGDAIQLDASGAEALDFDLDGDGVFEITAAAPGQQTVPTGKAGIIRPRVRGASDGGEAVAMGSVSLILGANMRPVANAEVDPAFGLAPLGCTMNGTGEDFDGTIAEYAWDFDGDGVFDHNSGADGLTAHNYAAAGLYNAKLRVTDDLGAWDVDTVAVQVSPDPFNIPPTITSMTANPTTIAAGGAVNFTSAAEDSDGSLVSFRWDFDNNGTFDITSIAPTRVFNTPGFYNVKLQVTDDGGGIDISFVGVNVIPGGGSNDPPVAVLNANPPEGNAGETVLLDGSASTSGMNSIVKYEFDLDGNGSYELDNGAVATTLKVFAAPGHYSVGLRVTNDDAPAQSATTTLQYTIHGWDAPVDPNSMQSLHPAALAVVDGHPAMAVYGSSMLQFIRALDPDGKQWGTPVIVDNTEGVIGWDPSLVIVNGNPAIAYYDPSNMLLKYCRASSSDGSSWGSRVTVDATAGRGQFPELLVVNGRPAICYYHHGQGDLWYVRASGANGGTWGAPLQVEGTVNQVHTSYPSSIALVNGFPAIAYHGDTDDDLRYVRATDLNGSAWGASLQLDGGGGMIAGQYCSMKVVAGVPAISYIYPAMNDLRYIRATDINGETWSPIATVDETNAVGFFSELEVFDGSPAIAYRDGSTGELKFKHAADAAGANWHTYPALVLDSNGDTGQYISFAIIGGTPAISYTDGAFNLHYLRNY